MSNVSLSAAARAAGVSEQELEEIEQCGQVDGQLNYAELAELIGLSPAKLKQVAEGWVPRTRDLSTWRELRCLTSTGEGMAVNCYLAWDEVSRDASLFDTGWDAQPILNCIAENALHLSHIFITHSHHDHVAALDEIRNAHPKTRIHSSKRNAPVDQRNRPNDFIHLGSLRITNRDTPGHADDGTTYVVGTWPDDAPHVAIVGDAIFAGSIGRGNQSWAVARQKVREQIFSLPADTLICPGHGPLTTVGEEKEHNPFF